MGLSCAKRLTAMVDTLLLIDRVESTLTEAAEGLSGAGRATVIPLVVDVTDREALGRLASRISELGSLGPVAHAAGISPTMADWKRVITVDLVGSAMLIDVLRPLATNGTAIVCFASMAPWLAFSREDAPAAADEALDDPLNEGLLEQLREAVGPSLEDSGMAYSWAKRGVQRLVRREAVLLGPLGARICAVSPGLIDTPQGRQEAETHPIMKELVAKTPLGREGQADDVAAVVSFLLSPEAAFVSGIDVLVDGGIVASLSQDQR